MNKKVIVVIISSFVLIALAVFLIIFDKNDYNNPSDAIGNTPSNLYNGGTFCQYEDKVFFANSNDGNALYVMNTDETKPKKISNSAILSINADKKRVYYSLSGKSNGSGLGYVRKSAGMYSCNHNGSDSLCYTFNPVNSLSLCGNKIFYENYDKSIGTTLYSVTINKKNDHQVDNALINPSCVKNGMIYYNGVKQDHYLYAMDATTETAAPLIELEMYNPVFHDDGYVYYIDPTDDYSLCRIDPQSLNISLISKERIDFFNIYGSVIYYQVSVGENPALHRVASDGSGDSIIASGVYKDIQTTSEYLYFRPFDSDEVTYHMHHGSSLVEPFIPSI